MSNNSDESRTPEALRARFEPHLLETFHDQRVLFEEGRIRLHATAHLECDAWGVSVRLEPETERDPFTVSGAWEILSVWRNRVGAAYVNWGISVPAQEEVP
jgi:hypothetical protein